MLYWEYNLSVNESWSKTMAENTTKSLHLLFDGENHVVWGKQQGL